MDFDAIVIGAGAAGMMCAATAGQRGRKILIIDHAAKLGEKIRISGGGRCNFTNVHCAPENFLSRNPHFCRSALARYTPRDFMGLIQRYRISFHEKKLGQLFCDDSAQDVINMLRAECDKGDVQWRMPCKVERVVFDAGQYDIHTDQGRFRAPKLVVATGGLSVPKVGATPFGYKLAEQFHLNIVPPRPALVPLAFDAAELERYGDLSGVSLDVDIHCGAGRFRENLLFTHRGLSGPAILQISSYWYAGEMLHIDLMPGESAQTYLSEHRHSRALPATLMGKYWPQRFAKQWCEAKGAVQPVDQMSDKAVHALATAIHDWQVRPSGTTGYAKAEVTLGGVDTNELSSKTMEAKQVPGLYFIGEVVDVTGHLGGFNFQWAWASGHAAGEAL
ncbi:MAG TPA: NAD(P)/FAD-dependent oxidoreductase [Burkholderiales bacterium]|nr:NAD(P)/FAD-dependent oxidoreductase [Burkholderiales bacterium]